MNEKRDTFYYILFLVAGILLIPLGLIMLINNFQVNEYFNFIGMLLMVGGLIMISSSFMFLSGNWKRDRSLSKEEVMKKYDLAAEKTISRTRTMYLAYYGLAIFLVVCVIVYGFFVSNASLMREFGGILILAIIALLILLFTNKFLTKIIFKLNRPLVEHIVQKA